MAASKVEPGHCKEPSDAADGDGDSRRYWIGARFELGSGSNHGSTSDRMQANDASPSKPIDLINEVDKNF
jgi:hypothetical protein